jgi:hypothetical protein
MMRLPAHLPVEHLVVKDVVKTLPQPLPLAVMENAVAPEEAVAATDPPEPETRDEMEEGTVMENAVAPAREEEEFDWLGMLLLEPTERDEEALWAVAGWLGAEEGPLRRLPWEALVEAARHSALLLVPPAPAGRSKAPPPPPTPVQPRDHFLLLRHPGQLSCQGAPAQRQP